MIGQRSVASGLLYVLTTLIGVTAFLYPFFLPAVTQAGGFAAAAHGNDAPLLLGGLTVICVGVLLLESQGVSSNARFIALLGVLVAFNSALRFIEVALPGPGGFTPIFFLITLGGYVYGAPFGFLLGALTLLVSAVITGGLGPWLPYQMLAAGWVGLSAPVCRAPVRWLSAFIRERGRVHLNADARKLTRREAFIELTVLTVFGVGWGLLYGVIINIWFWPYAAGASTMYWEPGIGGRETVARYATFYLATSAFWDFLGGLGNGLLMVMFGAPVLRVLRRFRQRFEVSVPETSSTPALTRPGWRHVSGGRGSMPTHPPTPSEEGGNGTATATTRPAATATDIPTALPQPTGTLIQATATHPPTPSEEGGNGTATVVPSQGGGNGDLTPRSRVQGGAGEQGDLTPRPPLQGGEGEEGGRLQAATRMYDVRTPAEHGVGRSLSTVTDQLSTAVNALPLTGKGGSETRPFTLRDTLPPAVWLGWAVVVSLWLSVTRNPFYLLLIALVLTLVRFLMPRQAAAPYAIPFRLLPLALVIVPFAGAANALFTHYGEHVLFRLPAGWLLVGGPITLEAFVFGALSGCALVLMLATFSILNHAVSPAALVALMPRAFRPVAVVAVIALGFIPALRGHAQRVREAQAVRGHTPRGWRDMLPLLLPLLIGGLEHAIQLAEAMAARGFGARERGLPRAARWAMVAGLGLLFGGWWWWLLGGRLPAQGVMALGAGLVVACLWALGRLQDYTPYRRYRWRAVDYGVVVVLGLALVPILLREASLFYYPYPSVGLPELSVAGLSGVVGLGVAGLRGK